MADKTLTEWKALSEQALKNLLYRGFRIEAKILREYIKLLEPWAMPAFAKEEFLNAENIETD